MVFKSYEKYLDKYNCDAINSMLYGDNPKIIKNFSVILMGIRFLEIYEILDDFEIDTEESGDHDYNTILGTSMSISKQKKKYIAKVFHDVYISQLHFRTNNWSNDYHNPIERFNA